MPQQLSLAKLWGLGKRPAMRVSPKPKAACAPKPPRTWAADLQDSTLCASCGQPESEHDFAQGGLCYKQAAASPRPCQHTADPAGSSTDSSDGGSASEYELCEEQVAHAAAGQPGALSAAVC